MSVLGIDLSRYTFIGYPGEADTVWCNDCDQDLGCISTLNDAVLMATGQEADAHPTAKDTPSNR